MPRNQDLPYGIQCIIAGFGAPSYTWSLAWRNGNKRWSMIWSSAGVAADWEANSTGNPIVGTFRVKLDNEKWHGRKPIFTQIVSASRAWAG